MDYYNLWSICITAFISVFVVLTVLAGVMQAIAALFPTKQQESSAAYVAAITSTVPTLIPGARVTRIEEVK